MTNFRLKTSNELKREIKKDEYTLKEKQFMLKILQKRLENIET